jgi:hypothetical protein
MSFPISKMCTCDFLVIKEKPYKRNIHLSFNTLNLGHLPRSPNISLLYSSSSEVTKINYEPNVIDNPRGTLVALPSTSSSNSIHLRISPNTPTSKTLTWTWLKMWLINSYLMHNKTSIDACTIDFFALDIKAFHWRSHALGAYYNDTDVLPKVLPFWL